MHNGESNEITAKLEALGFGAKLNKTEAYVNKEHANEISTFLIPKWIALLRSKWFVWHCLQ